MKRNDENGGFSVLIVSMVKGRLRKRKGSIVNNMTSDINRWRGVPLKRSPASWIYLKSSRPTPLELLLSWTKTFNKDPRIAIIKLVSQKVPKRRQEGEGGKEIWRN